jgi:alanine or glycine:cation symporter, AGCS family
MFLVSRGNDMTFAELVRSVANVAVSWPVISFVAGVSIICTIAFGFVQVRYFIRAWKYMLFPERTDASAVAGKVDMTPLQGFMNALNSSLGNGSIAGMGTAIFMGGPGAAMWLLIASFFLMAIRFAEVFLSAFVGAQMTTKTTIGGPMLYLKRVVGGNTLAFLYAICMVFFGLIGANAIQTNSIGLSITTTWGVNQYIIAVCVLLFMLYVTFGGAARIVKVSDRIVPVKIGVFFVSAIIVVIYHYHNIIPALHLMLSCALSTKAIAGGLVGITIQQAVKMGMIRGIFATESGLGTSAILFSSTGSTKPVRTGIMSMLVTFISTCVCFLVALCIVSSGVWDSGLQSAALTIASYNTVFGFYGGWIVSFLSIAFGVGVVVTGAYMTREAWLYLTGGRWNTVFTIVYSAVACAGTLVEVPVVWDFSNIVMAGMLLINMFGLLYLIPLTRRELKTFAREK